MGEHLPPAWRFVVRLISFALLGLCLAYVWVSLSKLDLGNLAAQLDWLDWTAVIITSIVYGASLILLATGWYRMAAPERSIRPVQILALYGPGVLAKYLPGSVFQYVSRQVMGKSFDVGQAGMAKASIAEAGLHVIVVVALAGPLIAGWAAVALPVYAAVALLLLCRPSSALVAAIALQLLFFCLFAVIVMLLCQLGPPIENLSRMVGFFFIAWVAGFLVPVAPGGIGVREAVLLAMASPVEMPASIAFIALITRLVNILGDALLGLSGYWAAIRENRQASE